MIKGNIFTEIIVINQYVFFNFEICLKCMFLMFVIFEINKMLKILIETTQNYSYMKLIPIEKYNAHSILKVQENILMK